MPTDPGDQQPLQSRSCVLCKKRKTRCNRVQPCLACVKFGAELQCAFRAPVAPRRGIRRPLEAVLLTRLNHYEDVLQSLGVEIERVTISKEHDLQGPSKSAADKTRSSDAYGFDRDNTRSGKLIAENGKSIYVETCLWKSLSDELVNGGETAFSDSSDGSDEAEEFGNPYSDYLSNSLLTPSPASLALDTKGWTRQSSTP